MKRITSRALPARIKAGDSARSKATLSPSWEETIQPLFGTSVTTTSSSEISQAPIVDVPLALNSLTRTVASVDAIALAIS